MKTRSFTLRKLGTRLLSGLALLSCFAISSYSQTNIANYSFSKSIGTYTPITGGTVFIAANTPFDQEISSAITIPSFNFGGTAVTTMYIAANGYITFGATPSTTNYTPLSTSGSNITGVIAGLAADLGYNAANATTGATSEIRYEQVGNEYVIQYADVKRWNSTNERISFQIRLNLTTGQIKIVYGGPIVIGSSTDALQIGIRGNSTAYASNVNNLMIGNVPAATSCNWSDAVTGYSNSSSFYMNSTNAAVTAVAGLTYTWTPGTQAPVRTFAAVSNILPTSATINFTAPSGATQYNVRYRVPGTCAWTNAPGNPYSGTAITLTGLTPLTTYQVQVQAVNGSAQSIWSHIPSETGGANGYTTSGTFTTLPSCVVPTALANNTITNNGATIKWNKPVVIPANGYEYYISTTNTAPTASTPATGTSTDTFKVISGLPSATLHYVWVRSSCSGTDKSAWTSSSTSFTTLCSTPAPGATIASSSTNLCAGAPVNFSLTTVPTGPGLSFLWQSSLDGVNYVNIANATTNTFSTNVSAVYYRCRVVCSGGPDTVYSTPVQLSYINNVTAATGAQRCGPGSVTLNASGNTGSIINWYDAATGGTSLGTGTSFTTPVVANTTSFYAEASIVQAGNAIVGTGTGTNSASTSVAAAYPSYFGNGRQQYLILASELLASGLEAGNITAMSFNVTSLGSPTTLNGYTIKMAPTTATAITTFQTPTFTTVWGAANYTPAVGTNTHTFTTSFPWDGISNIIVDICFSNAVTGSSSAQTRQSNTGFNSTVVYYADGTGGSGACTSTSVSTTSQLRPNITFAGQVSCRSARTAVTATINTAPAFAITNNKTVCNNAVTPLSVTTPQSSYNNVTWSPVTGLFTDAAATVPYVANTHAYTVYHKSNVVGSDEYIATAQNTTTLCGGIDTVKVQVLPPAITAIASPGVLCMSGSSLVKISPAIPQTGELYQWQSSNDNVTFTDIGTAGIADTLATGTLTATKYFRAIVKNSDSVSCFNSASDTVLVNNPVVTATTPGTRCGIGTVTLAAAGSAGTTLKWYTAATGGTALQTGNTFTTPVINNTTTYYVEAAAAGGTTSLGPVSPAAQGGTIGTQTIAWDVNFVVTQPTTLHSVDIYPVASGENGVIRILAGTGFSGTVLQTVNYTTNVSGGTTPQTITIDYPLAPGTYSLYTSTLPSSGIRRNTSGASYPYTSSVANITGNGYDPAYYMGLYNWVFASECISNRVPVVATVTPAPAFDITNDKTVCNNEVTTLSVTTGNSNYDSVTWSPATNLYTNAAATTPYVAGTNAATVYYKNATAGTVMVTAHAGNTATSCANIDTVKIQTLPASVTALATPGIVCESGISVLNYSPAIAQTGFSQQWSSSSDNINFTDISGATGLTYTSPAINNTQYYRVSIKNSDGTVCMSSSDTVKVLHPQLTSVTPAERCGPGSVTLGVTTVDGTATWYAGPTGGTVLGTGATFTTPSLNATTDYYVSVNNQVNDTFSVGNGAATSSTYPNPFYSLWSNTHNQYLITAAELSAAGIAAGNISSLAIRINSGTMAMQDFSVKMGHTNATNMSAFVAPAFTTVYTAATQTPVIGLNTFNFSTPFNWDGTSNVVIEICHGNSASGATMNSTAVVDNTPYVSTIHVHKSTSSAGSATCTDLTTNLNTYSVRPRFTFRNEFNLCGTPTRTAVTATIKPRPVAVLSPDGDINLCDGETQTLTASGGGTYTWLSNNTVIAGQTGNTLDVTQAEPYSVIVTGANGCTDTSVVANINIVPKPIVNLGNDTAVCANETLQLNAANPGATYAWSNNSTTQTIDVTTPGQYSVTVTNNFNCIAQDTITVSHLDFPIVNLGADTAICPSQPLTLNAENTGASYLWNDGSTTQTITVNQAGPYSVTVTNGANCTGTDTINVTLVPAIANYGFDFEPLFNVHPGRVRFTPVNINPNYTYSWDFGDGTTANQTIAEHDYSTSGNYVVKLNVSDGCADSLETLEIKVDLFTSVTRVKGADIVVKVYPNPTSNVLNVALESENTYINKLSIFNLIGQQVATIIPEHKNTKEQKVYLNDLASGAYLIKIETDKGTVNRKFEFVK